jgi:hypothetical protein
VVLENQVARGVPEKLEEQDVLEKVAAQVAPDDLALVQAGLI